MEGIKEFPFDNKEYQFQTKKIEKILIIIVFIIFYLSLNHPKSILFNTLFYGLDILFLVYYLVWFRKKPPYIKINRNEITIFNGLFFKSIQIKASDIKEIRIFDKSLILTYLEGNLNKEVKIHFLLLDELESKEIVKTFNEMKN